MSYQPGIDTELLRTFVAIAEHGGFTRCVGIERTAAARRAGTAAEAR